MERSLITYWEYLIVPSIPLGGRVFSPLTGSLTLVVLLIGLLVVWRIGSAALRDLRKLKATDAPWQKTRAGSLFMRYLAFLEHWPALGFVATAGAVFLLHLVVLPLLLNLAAPIAIGAFIALGLGGRHFLGDLLAGFILAASQGPNPSKAPFQVGHIIEWEGKRGRIKRHGTLRTVVQLSGGEELLVPNSVLTSGVVRLCTRSKSRYLLAVTLTRPGSETRPMMEKRLHQALGPELTEDATAKSRVFALESDTNLTRWRVHVVLPVERFAQEHQILTRLYTGEAVSSPLPEPPPVE